MVLNEIFEKNILSQAEIIENTRRFPNLEYDVIIIELTTNS